MALGAQIADVVLVDSENVLVDSELRARGLVRLVGYSVQTFDGTPLGKVRLGQRPAAALCSLQAALQGHSLSRSVCSTCERGNCCMENSAAACTAAPAVERRARRISWPAA